MNDILQFWKNFIAGSDLLTVLGWWAMLSGLGVVFLPIVRRLLPGCIDMAFPLAKVLCLATVSFVLWLAASLHMLPFSRGNIILFLVLTAAVSAKLLWSDRREYRLRDRRWIYLILGEMVFGAGLIAWAFVRYTRPDIGDLEKFMDYGFMNVILRTDYFPPNDIWFSGHTINYYYFGQYFCAMLIKLSGVPSEVCYNLLVATILAYMAQMGFSIAANAVYFIRGKAGTAAVVAGVVSAVMLTTSGNLHTAVYKVAPTQINRFCADMPRVAGALGIRNIPIKEYDYAQSTRFVGYRPEMDDKTITEFPAYSFIVSDLHGHVLDTIMVLALLFIILHMMAGRKEDCLTAGLQTPHPHAAMIFTPMLLAIFFMTNTWDFPIYGGMFALALAMRNASIHGWTRRCIGRTLLQLAMVFGGAILLITPFRMHFRVFAMGVNIVHSTTPLWQLFVLYGWQWFFAAWFLAMLVWRHWGNIRLISPLDRFLVLAIFISVICVIIPEIVYVQDIYAEAYYRANTMFKFSYQAVLVLDLLAGILAARIIMLLGVSSGPAIVGSGPVGASELSRQDALAGGLQTQGLTAPLRTNRLTAGLRTVAAAMPQVIAMVIMAIVLAMPLMFMQYAFDGYYKSWWRYDDDRRPKPSTLDGLNYIKRDHPEDYAMMLWLRENAPGDSIILEASGESWTYGGRISMATGLPTMLGWLSSHEHLWRHYIKHVADPVTLQEDEASKVEWYKNDPVTLREKDVQAIYRSADTGVARELLDKYGVRYVIIGDYERTWMRDLDKKDMEAAASAGAAGPEHPSEGQRIATIESLGTVVLESGDSKIIQVKDGP